MSLGDPVARTVAFIRAGCPQGVPQTDYSAAITRITDELPSPTDLDRVQRRLEARQPRTLVWPDESAGSRVSAPL